MSRVKTTLNVGQRLAEAEQRIARCKRVCAGLGWTDRELEQLRNGVDFRDLLRGKAVQR